MLRIPVILLLFACVFTAQARTCPSASLPVYLNPEQIRTDLEYLASDQLKGRRSGQEGALLARTYIAKRFLQSGLLSPELQKANGPEDYFSAFTLKGLFEDRTGINVVAITKGSRYPNDVIVFTAHYDHLGVQHGKVYNGADDNASGVSAMLAMADRSVRFPPAHTNIFVATEYEEQGLFGAKAFVEAPPVALERIRLNINLDMLSQPGSRGKLFVAGTRETPWLGEILQPLIERNPCVTFGHDGRSRSRYTQEYIDWRKSSDHWAFIRQQIPYLFLGVADHRHYHKPSDTAEQVHWPFYFNAVMTVNEIVQTINEHRFH